MRAVFNTNLILAAIAMTGATPTRRDGCGSLSGTGDVSNFKLAAVHELGDSITYPSLALIPETPSLFNSWIAVSDEDTLFNMTDGGITGEGGAVSQPVPNDSPLFFVSHVKIAPSPVYCAVTDGSISLPGGNENIEGLIGVLAVNGDAKSFGLCTANGIGHPQIVVYDPQEGADSFDFSSCSDVDVVLVTA
ncbi:hypothetical protein PENSPDRAFT_687404 [Peniophora sp. CONT]|nr:hypothetical protein PENSPDRAFT_687404 [Peniophora sp. CONT]